jgi:hypothetical protein
MKEGGSEAAAGQRFDLGRTTDGGAVQSGGEVVWRLMIVKRFF